MTKEKELLRRISSHTGTVIPAHFIYELQELIAQPEKEPLSDGVLSKEIDIIKKDADFSNVRPWQIYYLARRIEELHGIGGSDE